MCKDERGSKTFLYSLSWRGPGKLGTFRHPCLWHKTQQSKVFLLYHCSYVASFTRRSCKDGTGQQTVSKLLSSFVRGSGKTRKLNYFCFQPLPFTLHPAKPTSDVSWYPHSHREIIWNRHITCEKINLFFFPSLPFTQNPLKQDILLFTAT